MKIFSFESLFCDFLMSQSQYLDRASRYDFYFARKLVETICSDGYISHDFFHSCIKTEREDWDFNPLEDYVIVVHYFNGTLVEEISKCVGRNVKAVSLRLRMLLDIRNCLFFNPVGKNELAIELIIEGFRTRMMCFREYVNDLVIVNEFVTLYGEEDCNQAKVEIIKNTFRFA